MTELAELLAVPAARAALAQRDITAVYRILCEAGVTQARIAEATGQHQSDVSGILAGRRVQSVAVLERIADGLGVPRGWMGLAHAPGLVPDPGDTQIDSMQADNERDANLLRHGATVLFGAPVFGPADPIRIKPASTSVPRRIGPADVARVAATTERFRQLAGDLGGIPMTDALTAHALASEALLGAVMREPVRKRLLVAVSDAHRAAGCAASGAGLRDLARRHHTRGMDCAGAVHDLLRAVVSLDILGCMELDVEPDDALKFFQLGAASAPSLLSRAVVEYHGALALGLLGLAEQALDALRRAHDSYEAASNEPRPWAHFATGLPHVEGRTYLALGQFDRAVVVLASAGDAASHTVSCSMSNFVCLATAQLRCGEVRSGLITAERVVKLAKGLRSVSVRDDLAPLQQAAAARRDSGCQDLARELAILRRAA
ncbi:MAG: helix-turn-helix domain-containing protein [Pseudonocardiales bacterium]